MDGKNTACRQYRTSGAVFKFHAAECDASGKRYDSFEKRIALCGKTKEEKLILIIEDNGIGMTKEQIERIMYEKTDKRKHFNGIGIPNVMERIRLFFGEEYGLHYESEVGRFTRAIFTLPVMEEE